MSKLPVISEDWEALPPLPESLASLALAPFVALPKSLPHVVATSKLVELYEFTEDDWDIVWGANDYAMKAVVISKCDGIQPPESSDPTDSDICDEDAQDASGGSGEEDTGTITHQYWQDAAFAAQGKKRPGVWIKDTYIDVAHSGALNRGDAVHGPATPVRKPMPPMPTPSFSPNPGGGFKLDKSVKPVLRINNSTKKLEANPPTDECLDKDNKHVLVYDPKTEAMAWECQGGGGGCCGLLELTYVPPEGYGNGIARRIVGYTETGKFLYDEEEIPVKIPRI